MSSSDTARNSRKRPEGRKEEKTDKPLTPDQELTQELEQSFPASDPPSITQPGPAHEGAPEGKKQRKKKAGG